MEGFRYRGETDILTDELRAHASGKFVDLSDGRTHYELEGEKNAPTVVLIHGFSIPLQIWDTVCEPLLKAGFQVLRYDLYGRGYSDRPSQPYDRALFLRQLFELLQALRLNFPVDLVGLSMGGAISIAFCDQHPDLVHKLVLIDPAGLHLDVPRLANLIKLPIVGELVMNFFGDKFLVSSLADDLFSANKYPDYVNIVSKQMKIVGYRRALLSTIRHDMLDDLTEGYRSVGRQGRQSCLIWGVEDRSVPFENNKQVRAAIPDIEFHPIPDAGHVPHFERPEVVIPILVNFLKVDE